MILVLKRNTETACIEDLLTWLKDREVTPRVTVGEHQTIVGCVGDVTQMDEGVLRARFPFVESVRRILEPYKAANRKFHPDDTVVDCGGVSIGGGAFQVIAGPCSVESEEQLMTAARAVKAAGATLLRGGAFKPRSSPYAFQGLGKEGLRILLEAKKDTGLPIVTEILDSAHLDLYNDVDVLQIGARNMQNYSLLKELGSHTRQPILLKRGFSGTVQDLLMSAEYLLAGGNPNVILCERGIRTFETATRNTIDLAVIPLLHAKTHLPIVVDPSHATGQARLVAPLSLAATVIGADGLIVEVHPDPTHALSDGAQSLTPPAFEKMMNDIRRIRPFAWKEA